MSEQKQGKILATIMYRGGKIETPEFDDWEQYSDFVDERAGEILEAHGSMERREET